MSHAPFLNALFHHRWTVPALAELSARRGARVAELTSALGASRGGMVRALESLVALGLIARNPGHGHPLRPEYLLGALGEPAADEARRIVELADRWAIERVAFRKWPLPVTYLVGEAGARFSGLRAGLPGITDRALSDALSALADARLVERVVRPSHPPEVSYLPTERSSALLSPLRRLAKAA